MAWKLLFKGSDRAGGFWVTALLLVTVPEVEDENREYVPDEDPEVDEPMIEGKAGIEIVDEVDPVRGEAE